MFILYNPEAISTPRGYSHVAEVTGGKLVYIAGQVSLDRTGTLVGKDDFAAQTTQVFDNLKAAVEAAGGIFANVIKLNIYCVASVDRAQLPVMRQIRDQYVNTANPPVSTLVFVSGLALAEFLIEIEAIAVI